MQGKSSQKVLRTAVYSGGAEGICNTNKADKNTFTSCHRHVNGSPCKSPKSYSYYYFSGIF